MHLITMSFILNINSVTDELLSDDSWDICNVKEPDTCTQVRGQESATNIPLMYWYNNNS